MSTQSKLVIGLSLLMATAIAVLTLSPISAPPVGTVAQSDKIYHAVAFAGLVLPIAFFRPRWLILATPAYAAFGGLIEIVQPLAGRDCNLGDWSADLIGLCLGLLSVLLLRQSCPLVGSLRGGQQEKGDFHEQTAATSKMWRN